MVYCNSTISSCYWSRMGNFFYWGIKGCNKIGITPVLKNITDSTKESLQGIISESSKNTLDNKLNFNT